MKIGIVRFPGSNCDHDTKRYFKNSFYIWHNETILPTIDLLVIPGGFAFGDRVYSKATDTYIINPGQKALESPVITIIQKAYENKIPILGICNGFQILTKLEFLPGCLIRNNTEKFQSLPVKCILDPDNEKKNITLNIANSFGRYSAETDTLNNLKKNGQIFLKYTNFDNGSCDFIAGVCNSDKTVFGMMPHPERTVNCFKSYLFKQIDKTNIYNRIERLIKSEHISYKSTKKFLSKLYTQGNHVVQGPGENAGIIEIDDTYCLAMRIESHNHPIFIDPYNGAATGVGGIMRDIFTMGARPIGVLDFLRFGTDKYNDTLYRSVIKGISDYGNCFGVANIGGDFYRDETYNKNPLLNVACLGIVKKDHIIYGNALNTNSLLIYVGSKTGKEGVDGALMASNVFGNDVSHLTENIQTGDPFLEKLLMEACCEISEHKLAEGMQDMGAGGLLCASVEIIKRGREKTNKNIGCDIFLDRVPLKYNMNSCDILISESQERMLIVAQEKNKQEIFDIFNKWDLEYSVVGKTNNTGYYSVCRENEEIFVEHIDNFSAEEQNYNNKKQPPQVSECTKIKNTDLWTVYDSTIGGRTIKGPLEKGHYSILDIYETDKKILVTWGSNVETCLAPLKQFNAQPKGIVNCLNFGDPNECIGDFTCELNKLNNDCIKHKIPIIGGNVSLYNTTNHEQIKPTIVLVMVSIF